MKLTLNNIGILRNVEIDLSKDLIILCGPNNTGKTYAAYTAYAINKYAFQNELSLLRVDTKINFVAENELINNGITSIDIWKLFSDNKKMYSKEYADEVKSYLYLVFDTNRDIFKNAILNIDFQDDYIRNILIASAIEYSIKYGPFIVKFQKKAKDIQLAITIIENESSKTDSLKSLVSLILPDLLTDLIFQNIFQRTYIAPAERIAINLFSRQLSVQRNKLVDDLLSFSTSGTTGTSSTSGILSRAKLYPLPIRDSLEIAERLTEYQKQNSEFSYLADIFESEILHGKITISEYGEVQYSPIFENNNHDSQIKIEVINAKYGLDDNFEDVTDILQLKGIELNQRIVSNELIGNDPIPGKWKQLILDWTVNDISYSNTFLEGEKIDLFSVKPLAIHLTASMVKSLSSLVFYFRHIAHKGDFIIIDEPELNLHPDNQRKIAKLLARIVNAGFKVMISTHSDYIYRELNNQIMLNKDSDIAKKLRTTYDYKTEELLDHNKIGAYLFLGNETRMLPVTEAGFEVKTIDDEIGELNEASMEIFTSLF